MKKMNLTNEMAFFTNMIMTCVSYYLMDMASPVATPEMRELAKRNYISFTTNLTNTLTGLLVKHGRLDDIKLDKKKRSQLNEEWLKFLANAKELEKKKVKKEEKKDDGSRDYYV